MKQIIGPTRSPSGPVGLHLEVELKPQLKSHVGQKNGRHAHDSGAQWSWPKAHGSCQSARSTNTESGRPRLYHHNVEVIASHQDTESGSRNHSYFIAYEDRVHIKLVRARIFHQHILADRRLGTLLYFSIVWHLIHRLRNRLHETAARIFASTPPYRSAFRPRRTQQKVSS